MAEITQLLGNEGSRYLSFSLGNDEFAMPLLVVKEVIAVPDLTKMPFSPNYFLGIMNLRGDIIPVIDLRRKLEVSPSDKPSEPAVVICDLAPYSLGIKVDSVNSVVSLSAKDISPNPDAPGGSNREFVSAVYRRAKSLVLLIDIAKVLSSIDRQSIEESQRINKAS